MNSFALKKVKTGLHNQHIHIISGATWSNSKASYLELKSNRISFAKLIKHFEHGSVHDQKKLTQNP